MKKSGLLFALLLIISIFSGCISGIHTNTNRKDIPEKYVPIGTVVLLVDGTQPLMITARAVEFDSGEQRDYSAVLYPYGYIDTTHVYSFNHSEIAEILYLGYISDVEEEVNNYLLEHIQ